jgi:hypothetical protein
MRSVTPVGRLGANVPLTRRMEERIDAMLASRITGGKWTWDGFAYSSRS